MHELEMVLLADVVTQTYWLREDRLQLSDEAVDLELTCERCGKPITSGRFCPECKEDEMYSEPSTILDSRITISGCISVRRGSTNCSWHRCQRNRSEMWSEMLFGH